MTTAAIEIVSRCKGNECYRRAVESSDSYRAAAALRERLLEKRLALPAVRQPEPPVSPDDVDRWLSAVVEADVAARAREAQEAALVNQLRQVEGAVVASASDRDRLLRMLASELGDLMAEVGSVVQRLGGARNAREAITARTGDMWLALTGLRERYDRLRQAQGWVMTGVDQRINCHSQYLVDDHADDSWIANLDELVPGWREPDRTIRISGQVPDRRPWPSDPIEMLVYLAVSDAEVWLPTLRELDQLHAKRRARRNPPQKPKQHNEFPQQTQAKYRPAQRIIASG